MGPRSTQSDRILFVKRLEDGHLFWALLAPLTFADEADYARARQGDQWELADFHGILEWGEDECRARIAGTGEELRLRASFTPRERRVLLASGLLAYTRAG